jgi:dTDP-4-dehydro-6-deoxy-alpha-D-glucopyranose 2,3-dehydratase
MVTMQTKERILRILAEDGYSAPDAENRVNQLLESANEKNSLHTLDYVMDWFEKQRKNCTMKVKEVNIADLDGWITDGTTKNISHTSGEFFSVRGAHVEQTFKREVPSWSQPLFFQKEWGIIGVLRKKINGVYHYLLNAKAEPGNIDKLQMSPTLQATFSNLKQAHHGRKPLFWEYFEDDGRSKIIYSRHQTEDGGRFYLKANRNMLVEVSEDEKIDVPDDFIWVTMYQIKQMLKHDTLVTPHVRSIISVL